MKSLSFKESWCNAVIKDRYLQLRTFAGLSQCNILQLWIWLFNFSMGEGGMYIVHLSIIFHLKEFLHCKTYFYLNHVDALSDFIEKYTVGQRKPHLLIKFMMIMIKMMIMMMMMISIVIIIFLDKVVNKYLLSLRQCSTY